MSRAPMFGSSLLWLLVASPAFVSYAATPSRPLFGTHPSVTELVNAKIFQESLLPLGKPSNSENRALAQALNAFVASPDRENFAPLVSFLDKHPKSPWRASLLANLGCEYRSKGYFTKSMAALESAWDLSKGVSTRSGREVSLFALGEWAQWSALLGLEDRAERALKESNGRLLMGTVTEKLTSARETLRFMKEKPEYALRCGPLALMHLKTLLDERAHQDPLFHSLKATPKGTNLAMNQRWAEEAGMRFQMAKRQPGGQLVVPALVHFKTGHFAALVREDDGKFLAKDPSLGEVWFSKEALEEELSGYGLITPGQLPQGWTTLASTEGEKVWGRCHPWAASSTTPLDVRPPESCPPAGSKTVGGDLCGCPTKGMPRYTLHNAAVSLSISDTPIGYAPPRGPRIDFTVHYSQRESMQPQHFDYANLGPKWSFNWLSCLMDDTRNPNLNVVMCYPGGGGLMFKPLGNGTFATENYTQAQLTKNADGTYVLREKDGSQKFFTIADRTTGIRRIVLTKITDKAGNAVQLNWDAKLRLMSIVDPLGQVTTLSYELPSDDLKITKVATSSFGAFNRSATFGYDAQGRLERITDAVGMISTFSYGPTSECPTAPADFINAMTTPYGTTRFFMGESPDRWLEVEDPLGQRERLETGHYSITAENVPLIPEIPANPAPWGVRRSMHWDKRAYAGRVKDYTKAHDFQWGYGPSNFANGILVSEKKPLENRVWYIAAGGYNDELTPFQGNFGASTAPVAASRTVQAKVLSTAEREIIAVIPPELKGPTRTAAASTGSKLKVAARSLSAAPSLPPTLMSNFYGAIDLVTRQVRLLDDGRTQLYKYEYDLAGHQVQSIDPAGRTTMNIYSGDNLMEVRNTTNGANDLLAKYTYNTLGLPLTITGADGKTTVYTYNAGGQVTSITNAKGEATTMAYDAQGFLTSITGAQSGATTSFTYDVVGRVRTVTGPDGVTVTTDYDDLDRPTKVTYPDGTTEEMVYDRLDLARKKDRKDQWTQMSYNPLRQLTDVQDPQGRVTQFEWCGCGNQLESLKDPMGRITNWWRDLQGRVIGKRLHDGTQTDYAYDSMGRLVQRVDAKGQKTFYQYYLDNNLAQVDYADTERPTPPVSYTYDPSYNRVATSTGTFGTTAYTYYPITETPALGAGRLASVQGPFPNSKITYTYDALGRVTTRDINGTAESRVFDNLGRVETVTNPLGTFQYGYQGATGRLDHINLPNGQVHTFSYFDASQDNRLKEIKNAKSSGDVISAFGYTYDVNGLIKTWSQQADATPPKVYTFDYDAVGQLKSAVLTGATGALIHEYLYGYDLAGNRTSEQIDGNITTAEHNETNQVTSQRNAAMSAARAGGATSAPKSVKPVVIPVP